MCSALSSPQIARNVAHLITAAVVIAYPAVVYAGLQYFDAWVVALLLLIAAIVRLMALGRRDIERQVLTPLIGGAVVLAATAIFVFVFNCDRCLRFYPVFMSLLLFGIFFWTLRNPPSMVERFARLSNPDLSGAAVSYTRGVTQVWCGFLLCNAAIALYSSIGPSLELWAIYNGLISYCVMGLICAAEFVVRCRVIGRAAP
ncbi:MAG TPA: hypothetical protein P5340_03750 [Defluviicoccus sp.]|nr:hypothetical protein [Defluviicoccus sp.]